MMMHSPNDFKIEIETEYLSAQSDITMPQFVFSYTISIINTGTLSAQLISRHWLITNGEGEVHNVRGLGVVGEQPNISPGQCYRYTSGTMLPTPLGTMQGTYQMRSENGDLFEVNIPFFKLAVPSLIN